MPPCLLCMLFLFRCTWYEYLWSGRFVGTWYETARASWVPGTRRLYQQISISVQTRQMKKHPLLVQRWPHTLLNQGVAGRTHCSCLCTGVQLQRRRIVRDGSLQRCFAVDAAVPLLCVWPPRLERARTIKSNPQPDATSAA